MCGTIGFVDKCGAFDDGEKKALIGRMIDSIEHRGRDGTGHFMFPAIPIGQYRILAELQGFQPVTLNDNLVETEKTTRVDVQLKVGTSTTLTLKPDGIELKAGRLSATMDLDVLVKALNIALEAKAALQTKGPAFSHSAS